MAINILVVDDSGLMRKLVIKALRQCELPLGEIVEGANGDEGLKALERSRVDAILADINMPVMDGKVMFEKIRKDPRFSDIPVIFISSESDASSIQVLLEAGAGFVHKPFTPEIIKEAVLMRLGGAHAG